MIKVSDQYFLSVSTMQDKDSYVEHMKDKQIYQQTISIPFPYSEQDAIKYIELCASRNAELTAPAIFALRNKEGQMIGNIGAFGFKGGGHKAEIAYWLAKSYRNQGIMSQTINTFCEYLISTFYLVRIEALCFDFNIGSARVLEKNNFQLEGVFKKFYRKDGQFFDAKMYGRVL